MIYAKLVAALLILSAIIAAILSYGHKRYEAGKAEVSAQWAEETARLTRQALDQSQENRRIEAKQQARAGEIDRDTQTKLQQAQASARAARASSDSLRDELSQLRASAAATASDTARSARVISALADSLQDCSGRYGAVAQERDGLAIQVTGLQEFVAAEREP